MTLVGPRDAWALGAQIRQTNHHGDWLSRSVKIPVCQVTVRRKVSFSLMLLALVIPLCASSAQTAQHAVPSSAKEIVLTLDPGRSMLHWTLGTTLHTVHGTFTLKRGTVRFGEDTNYVKGEIVADATSGESGNGSRDKRMHNEILESQRYTEVIFRPEEVMGNLLPKGPSSVKIRGEITLHGSEHELTVPVQVEMTNDHWNGTAKFAVPYIQWGLKNPSNFLLKVDGTVQIDLEMTGNLRSSPQP